jgi:hypothetical protein
MVVAITCIREKMADTKRSRAAKLGARTRARNVSLHGPTARSTARRTENERIIAGRTTLADVYDGVPSRANFLKNAHLFERPADEGSGTKTTKTDRAYIIPDGLDTLRRGEETRLFWYRRNTSIERPTEQAMSTVFMKDGNEFTLEALEDAPRTWQTQLGHKSFARSCTGIVRFYVT